MSLNAVQFDMLCLENKLMTHGRRTWVRHSRHKECELLGKFFGRNIGKSWLDNNRGALKRDGYHRSWQHGLRERGGVFDGSESRRQFTYKTCNALSSRGIKVFRQVWHALKKGFTPPAPETPQVVELPTTEVQRPKRPGQTDFEDPATRKRLGLPEKPPWKTD